MLGSLTHTGKDGLEWNSTDLEEAESLKGAKQVLKKAGGQWKQGAKHGNGVTTAVLQCNSHVSCGRYCMIRRAANAMFQIWMRGDHAEEDKLKKRKNSILNFEEEYALRTGCDSGNTPGTVLATMTKEKEKKLRDEGKDPLEHKRKEGGLDCASSFALLSALCTPV